TSKRHSESLAKRSRGPITCPPKEKAGPTGLLLACKLGVPSVALAWLPRYIRPKHLFVRASTSQIGFKGAFSLKDMQEVSNIRTLFNGNPFFPPLSLPPGGGPEPSLLRPAACCSGFSGLEERPWG